MENKVLANLAYLALTLVIVAIFSVIALAFITHNELTKIQNQLDDMPKRVCHEETEKITLEGTMDCPLSAKITCEEGVDVFPLEYLGRQVIYTSLEDRGKTCLITKEVCEVV